MDLGYDGKLYILAFDHRGSFQKKMFGIEGDPDAEQTERISDAKHLIFEGMLKAAESGAEPGVSGCLVDEQFGAPKGIPQQAKERGLVLSMPVEKSGQNEFDFEYGDAFGDHIEKFDPDFAKVLVRYNPDVWKIEGIETQEDCGRIAQTARRDGRDGVICVVLGRGADDAKVEHWLRQGAPVDGYAGFAIGRTIWWDALEGFIEGDLEREDAARQIAENYLRFVRVYGEAAREPAAA